jgi:ketosteroid isomerase-like protein
VTSEQNVEIVRQAFEAFGPSPSPRPEVLEAFFDPEIEWVAAPDSLLAGSYHGYEGVQRFWERIHSALDDYRLELLEFSAVGDDRVAMSTRAHARTRGIEVDQRWSVLVALCDGKISRVESFSKPEGALEAAGLSS